MKIQNMSKYLNVRESSMRYFLDEAGVDELVKQYKDYVDNLNPEPEPEPKPATFVYDETTQRYTNDSIKAVIDSNRDGKIYSVDLGDINSTVGTKTDDNEGLILEPSTSTVAGQNDYKDIELFSCRLCNGGVDEDGMPYVTAIEGVDDRFSRTDSDVWIITPIYYVKYEDNVSTISKKSISDTEFEGSTICVGAYTLDKKERPYILRSVYACSDPNGNSISGKSVITDNWTLNNMYNRLQTRNDGVTFYTAADHTYIIDFMQIMLGVKRIRDAIPGNSAKECITGVTDDYLGTWGYNDYNPIKFQNMELVPVRKNLIISNISNYNPKIIFHENAKDNLLTSTNGITLDYTYGGFSNWMYNINSYIVRYGITIPYNFSGSPSQGYYVNAYYTASANYIIGMGGDSTQYDSMILSYLTISNTSSHSNTYCQLSSIGQSYIPELHE